MGIRDEIFAAFFRALEEDSTVPKSIVTGLSEMSQPERSISEESIFALIRGAYTNGGEDQED